MTCRTLVIEDEVERCQSCGRPAAGLSFPEGGCYCDDCYGDAERENEEDVEPSDTDYKVDGEDAPYPIHQHPARLQVIAQDVLDESSF